MRYLSLSSYLCTTNKFDMTYTEYSMLISNYLATRQRYYIKYCTYIYYFQFFFGFPPSPGL